MNDPLLDLATRATRELEAAGFVYAAVGATARNAWARPRATTDLDFAIAIPAGRLAALRAVTGALGLDVRKERKGEAEVPELILLVHRDDPQLRIDLLVAQTPFEESVLARRVRAAVAGLELWVASPEDLLVYKLVAGRPRDLGDVVEVVRARESLGATIDWPYVERWTEEFGVSDRVDALRRQITS